MSKPSASASAPAAKPPKDRLYDDEDVQVVTVESQKAPAGEEDQPSAKADAEKKKKKAAKKAAKDKERAEKKAVKAKEREEKKAAKAMEKKAAKDKADEARKSFEEDKRACMAELFALAKEYDDTQVGDLMSCLMKRARYLVETRRADAECRGAVEEEKVHNDALEDYLVRTGVFHAEAHRTEARSEYYIDLRVFMLDKILTLAEDECNAELRFAGPELEEHVNDAIDGLEKTPLSDPRLEAELKQYLLDRVPKKWAIRAAASKKKAEDREKEEAPAPPPRPASPPYVPSPADEEPPLLAAAHPGNTAPSGGIAGVAAVEAEAARAANEKKEEKRAAAPVAAAAAAAASSSSSAAAASGKKDANLLDVVQSLRIRTGLLERQVERIAVQTNKTLVSILDVIKGLTLVADGFCQAGLSAEIVVRDEKGPTAKRHADEAAEVSAPKRFKAKRPGDEAP